MLTNFEPVPGVIRVSLSQQNFGPFYVLVVPDPKTNLRRYYLMHETSGIVLFMFGSGQPETDEHAAELAYWSGPDYIPEFVKQHFTEEE